MRIVYTIAKAGLPADASPVAVCRRRLSALVPASCTCCLLVMSLLAAPLQAAEVPDPSAPPADVVAPPQEFEDAPALLVPKVPRTQPESDQLEALSLFAAGRMLEQDEKSLEALRMYQRALRLDPHALPVLRQIVPLAFGLGRSSEAIRYALKVVELDPSDPLILRQLGAQLTEEGDVDKALALYEQSRSLQKEKKAPSYIFLTMEMGRLNQLLKRYTQAADLYQEVMAALDAPQDYGLNETMQKGLAAEPDKTYTAFGEVLLLAERPDQALAAFNKAEAVQPNPTRHAYRLAQVAALKKDYPQVIVQLQVYLDQRGTEQRLAPYALLKQVLKDAGQEAELLPKLQAALAADAENVALKFFVADELREAGNLAAARPLFTELLNADDDAEFVAVGAYRGLAKIERTAQDTTALLAIIDAAVGKMRNLSLLAEEAEAIAKDKELVAALIAAVRAHHQEKPGGASLGESLGVAMLALENQNFDAANELFEIALAADPKHAEELVRTWGVGQLLSERYADAARTFQRGIDGKLLPDDRPDFYFLLAGALEMDGQTDAALRAARRAASLGKGSARVSSRIGWILYHAKRHAEAVESYRDLIKRHDSDMDDEVRQTLREARLVLSNICVLQNDLPQAEEWLEQVLDEFPGDISALNDLGYLWADQGKNLERALQMVQEAVAGDPDNTAYRDSLGWAYYRLGRYDEALVEMKKAVEDTSPDGVIFDHLGDVYHKLNQTAEARAAWQRAVEQFEQDKEMVKLKAVQEKLAQSAM